MLAVCSILVAWCWGAQLLLQLLALLLQHGVLRLQLLHPLVHLVELFSKRAVAGADSNVLLLQGLQACLHLLHLLVGTIAATMVDIGVTCKGVP